MNSLESSNCRDSNSLELKFVLIFKNVSLVFFWALAEWGLYLFLLEWFFPASVSLCCWARVLYNFCACFSYRGSYCASVCYTVQQDSLCILECGAVSREHGKGCQVVTVNSLKPLTEWQGAPRSSPYQGFSPSTSELFLYSLFVLFFLNLGYQEAQLP